MNRNIILIALLALLSVGKAAAQSVTVEAKIDSLQILIGEQAKVQLQVAMDAKQRAIFPAYTDTLVRGVEIIETVKPDTQFLNDRQRMLITQEYIITSFDSALYYLPPMPVTVDDKVYKSKALALKVYSMPVDTLHPDQFFGQQPHIRFSAELVHGNTDRKQLGIGAVGTFTEILHVFFGKSLNQNAILCYPWLHHITR